MTCRGRGVNQGLVTWWITRLDAQAGSQDRGQGRPRRPPAPVRDRRVRSHRQSCWTDFQSLVVVCWRQQRKRLRFTNNFLQLLMLLNSYELVIAHIHALLSRSWICNYERSCTKHRCGHFTQFKSTNKTTGNNFDFYSLRTTNHELNNIWATIYIVILSNTLVSYCIQTLLVK